MKSALVLILLLYYTIHGHIYRGAERLRSACRVPFSPDPDYADRRFFMYFGLFNIMFSLVFLIVIAIFIITFVQGITQWNKNNHSPRLTVPALITGKRTNVTHHHDANNHTMSHTSTTYYVTFQVESGDRMEFIVSGQEYGKLAEGDMGMVTFQGTRYLGFERQ